MWSLKMVAFYMPKFGHNQGSVQICIISATHYWGINVYKFVLSPHGNLYTHASFPSNNHKSITNCVKATQLQRK